MRPVATQSCFTTPWRGLIPLLLPFGSGIQLFQTFQPAFPIFWFRHFLLLFLPRKLDVQERALSVLTQSTRGGFQWPTMMFKTLGPISLPATNTLQPTEGSMKA